MSKALVALGNTLYNKVLLKTPGTIKRLVGTLQRGANELLRQYKLSNNPLHQLPQKWVQRVSIIQRTFPISTNHSGHRPFSPFRPRTLW